MFPQLQQFLPQRKNTIIVGQVGVLIFESCPHFHRSNLKDQRLTH